jgi:hypothetical protein
VFGGKQARQCFKAWNALSLSEARGVRRYVDNSREHDALGLADRFCMALSNQPKPNDRQPYEFIHYLQSTHERSTR